MQVTYVVVALDPGKIIYEIEMDGIYSLQVSFPIHSVCTAAHTIRIRALLIYFFLIRFFVSVCL